MKKKIKKKSRAKIKVRIKDSEKILQITTNRK